MNSQAFSITFPTATKAEANQFAQTLAQSLTERIPGLDSATAVREVEDTQDFGSTVVLILGTAAATEVARGIHNLLSRIGSQATLKKDGTVILKDIRSEDIATIAKSLSSKLEK